jgi:DNA topoisomerase III
LKSLWRMSRRRPARRIRQKNNSIGGVCRLTYCNPKQIGGILIAKLIVAEKPSVAMSYAKVLGTTNRKDGYLEGNGYLVSWCVGHLVELAPPNIYDAKYVKWSIADLPILPERWQYLVSASTKKQFGILQKLMHRPDVDSVICATDAGREGELIFRLVYQQAGCKKPVFRLWLSSMEENAIREGFAHLKPSTEYDALYNAALCRERADWMVGINASRLFSCLYGQPLAVGRVMTPVLAMTVVREAAIAAFTPEKFYTVALTLADGGTASSKRFAQKADAELLLSKCRKEGRVTVQKMERKEKSESPPQLYDLTALQRDANRLLGFTAQQTLDYAQSLYEKRLITYPRTDSRFLTEDMAASLPGLVTDTGRALAVEEPFPIHVQQVINGSKVTDHHALLPTKSMANADLAALPAGEWNVLRLIAARLLCAVGEPHRYAETTLTTICAGEEFTAKGKEVLEEGWKAVERKVLADILNRKQELTALPNAAENECGILNAELKEGQTTPPKHFTEDTLLHAMETASADSMPEGVERQGIGTPATRAATIEKLVQKGFLERKGNKKTKVLLPTDKGKALITVMPEEIQSPEMTADWETKLLQIERGEMEPSEFMTEINTMITELVKNTEMKKGANALMKSKIIGVCPNCGKPVVEREKGWFCENRECRFVLWKDNAFFKRLGKRLDAHVADKLLRDGRVRLKDCKSAKGKTYNATVLLSCEADGRSKFSLEFEGGC